MTRIWIRFKASTSILSIGPARLLGRTAEARITSGEEAGPQAVVGLYSLGIIPSIA